MGVTIRILDNGSGLEFLQYGVVQGNEIIQARNEIYNITDRVTNFKYIIINKLQCTEYNVTADEIVSLAKLDIYVSRINPNIIVAVIESEYLRFSLTDVWHAHIEDYISKIKSFKNRSSALAWIKNNMPQI